MAAITGIRASTASAFRHSTLRVGVIGLGTGTVASYARPGDVLRYYEIDPQVDTIAHEQFTYLDDARARGATILCELAGYGTSDDAYHISAPAENGAGAAISMRSTSSTCTTPKSKMPPGSGCTAPAVTKRLSVSKELRGTLSVYSISWRNWNRAYGAWRDRLRRQGNMIGLRMNYGRCC